MDPISASLAIAVPLVGLLVWWIKRKAAKSDDPKEQLKETYREIDQAISKGDAGVADINRMVADMERMQDARGSHSGEQGNQIRRDELHSSTGSNANPTPQSGQRKPFEERLTHEPNTK